jgi:hypothetical protein
VIATGIKGYNCEHSAKRLAPSFDFLHRHSDYQTNKNQY